MAQLTGGTTGPLRMDQFDVSELNDADVISSSSTQLKGDLGDGFIITFTGTGFTYNGAGEPTGGTITGINETENGATLYNVTGLSTSVTQFSALVEANNSGGALQLLLVGNDDIQGTTFDDLLGGADGHDYISGGLGADTLLGGAGNDHLYGLSTVGGADGGDQIGGGEGGDYLQGNGGNDSLDGGAGSDRINGGTDQDSIIGGSGNDSINGNLGNDTISGGADNDSLRGGQGNDAISGGDGDDKLWGDLGVDSLTGGAGVDYFLFGGNSALFSGASADVVTDFQDGVDLIGVGYVPAAVLTGATQASFSAAATLAQQLFDGHAGNAEVAAIKVGADAFLFYSSDGGATANSAVQLSGIDPAVIGTNDFV